MNAEMTKKSYRKSLGTLAAIAALGLAAQVNAAAVASDNAGNYIGQGWSSGQNFGTGFGPWQFGGTDNNFYYVSSSSTNGGSPNIDTAGVAWGMSVGGGRFIDATRPFTSGGPNNSASLAVGQSVTWSFDNGGITSGGVVGVSLRDSSNGNRFEYYYTGGNPSGTYTVNNGATVQTVRTYTNGGMNLTFTLTTPETFLFTVDFLESTASTEVFTGTLGGTFGAGIDRIRLFNFNADYGSGSNQYFNSIAVTNVIPEPTTLAAGALLVGLALKRRRD